MLTPLERESIAEFRSGSPSLHTSTAGIGDWIRFGLRLMWEAGTRVRRHRYSTGEDGVMMKHDGTPVTRIDRDIEHLLHERLAVFDPLARIIGEETGGSFPESGIAVAIDPVDGTWAFVNGTETIATTLAVFADRNIRLAMISNPLTGEIAYATPNGPSRLLHLAVFGDRDDACDLPMDTTADAPLLVNVHPGRAAGKLIGELYALWARHDVDLVRSPGGSPSWALVEASKGKFVYLNPWTKHSTKPYDLAAGTLIIRAAGGDVIGLDGNPIDPLAHTGPFIASIRSSSRDYLVTAVRHQLTAAGS